MGRFAAADVLLLAFDEQVRYFDQALSIAVGSVTSPAHQEPDYRHDVLSFLSSVAATPIGAEIAVHRLNSFRLEDPVLAEVKLLTTLTILLESLSSFPLNNPKKVASDQDVWIQNQSQNWHVAAKKAKVAFEEIVNDLLISNPKSEIALFIQSSQPLTRKVAQVVAELFLWFPPSEWSSTLANFRSALQRPPNALPESFLRPSVFFVTVLRETLSQVSANPGYTDKTSAKSAWEIGRLTATARNELVQQTSEWVDLAWVSVAQDFEFCYNSQILPGTPSLNSHIAAFAETIQLHVSVSKATGNTKSLIAADWKFFMSPYVLKSSQCRLVCEAFSDCIEDLHASKRVKKSATGLRPVTLSPAKQRELILSTMSILETLILRSHPGLTGLSSCDPDDIYSILRTCASLTLLMRTEGCGEFISRANIMASMLLSHPATLIATNALALWEAVIVQLQEINDILIPTLHLIWMRCLRCGDPAVREAAGQDPLKWLNDTMINVVQRLLGTMNGVVWKSTTSWSGLTEICTLAEDENFAVDSGSAIDNPILPNFATFRNTLKRIVETFTETNPTLLNAIGQSAVEVVHELLVNPQFSESSRQTFYPVNTDLSIYMLSVFQVPPHNIKTVSGRIKGFLNPAYTALDLMCFVVEVCNSRSELKNKVRQLLSEISSSNLSVVDSHSVMVNPTHYILTLSLGVHGHMLEHRRVDLIGQVGKTAVPLVRELSEMLFKRLVLTAPAAERSEAERCDEEEYFYMLRSKARESLTTLWVNAMTTEIVTFSDMGPLIDLFGRRAHDPNLSEDERSGCSRSVLSLAASTGDFQTGSEAFNAVGGQLLQGVLRDFHNRNLTSENLRAYLLDGPDDAASQRRRVLLRELQTCEDVFEKLSLPQTCGGMTKGSFLTDTTQRLNFSDPHLTSKIECENFNYEFNNVLTDFVETSYPIFGSICQSFIQMWSLPAVANLRQQLNEIDIEELMKPSGKFSSLLCLRHLVHIRSLFRVVGSIIKLLISQRLYGKRDQLQSSKNFIENLISALVGDPMMLKSVPIVYKDAIVSSVLFGGVLHSFNPWRLPSTATEIPPVMLDGACFFFPDQQSASFHLDLLETSIPGLSNSVSDMLSEWEDSKRIRDQIVGGNLQQESDVAIDKLQSRLSQLVHYATSTCHGFHCLFNITKRGGASTGEIILQPLRTIGSLRGILHRILKRNLFLRPNLTQQLLDLTMKLSQVPHPSVSSIMHQVIRAYFSHSYTQILFVVKNEQIPDHFVRNLLTKFSATACNAYMSIILRSFHPIDDHDPYFLQEIPLDRPPCPYGRLATYYALGGPSESPNRAYFALPTTINRHTNQYTIAPRADLAEKSFCYDQVATLHEIARNAVLAFSLKCNILFFCEPPSTDIQENLLTQIDSDPDLRKILSSVANEQSFNFVFGEDQLLVSGHSEILCYFKMQQWIRNMCSNRSNHDSRLARDELKYFLLENILKTNQL